VRIDTLGQVPFDALPRRVLKNASIDELVPLCVLQLRTDFDVQMQNDEVIAVFQQSASFRDEGIVRCSQS